MKKNFIDDENKVNDMIELSRKKFLMTYCEETEVEFENTKELLLQFVKSKKNLTQKLNENLNKS